MEKKPDEIVEFKITADVTKESGPRHNEYTGSAFLVVVNGDEGMHIECKADSPDDGIRLMAGAIGTIVKLAISNGAPLAQVFDMVSRSASLGIDHALGVSHECTNCGECGKDLKH